MASHQDPILARLQLNFLGTSISYKIDGNAKNLFVDQDGQTVLTSHPGHDGLVVKTLRTSESDRITLVETTITIPQGVTILSVDDRYAVSNNVEFTWLPHLSPREGMLIGDMVFRSPAAVFSNAEGMAALIPDLDDLEQLAQRLPAVMDFDRRTGELYYGFRPYRVADRHVYFEQDPERSLVEGPTTVTLRYYLISDLSKHQSALDHVSRFLWERFGAKRMIDAPVQFAPLETYVKYAYDWAFDRWRDICWNEFMLDGERVGSVVFIVTAQQSPNYPEKVGWREIKSIWNQAWFSSLRSAYGYYRWGQAWDRPDLIEKARLSKAFALAAPQKDGLFPCFYAAGPDGSWEEGHWEISSNRRPPGHENYYHLLDCSWTALWMLRWYRDLEQDERLLDYVEAYIQRLLTLQRPSGAFASWVEADSGEVSPFLDESPQTAMHVLLLSEWASFRNDPAASQAAIKAADFLINEIIPHGRWEDFETYWSCSKQWEMKQYGVKDEKSGMYAQCSFSIYWTAEALRVLYEHTGESKYLEAGVQTLGELSLYQQVWDPPFVDIPAFGGFGVMNTDGEWNDARQSLFAPAYMHYYRHTGLREHFERGVAALRAAFTMMYAPENETVKQLYEAKHPHFNEIDYGFEMENFAHGGTSGTDGIGVFTIFDWGCGSAAASAAMVKATFGDIYVDIDRKQAFGINGCEATWEQEQIRILETVGKTRPVKVVFSDGRTLDVQLPAKESVLVKG